MLKPIVDSNVLKELVTDGDIKKLEDQFVLNIKQLDSVHNIKNVKEFINYMFKENVSQFVEELEENTEFQAGK